MGEGAGYAGGIVSAAVDGIRVAEAVARGCGPPSLPAIIEHPPGPSEQVQ